MRYKSFLILGFLIVLLVGASLSIVSADVFSINSGGDRSMIINPDSLIENIFFKGNRLPIASNLILSSSASGNTTNGNLSISYNAYDPDGDFITNITDWRVNGNSIAVLNMPFDKAVAELTSGAVRDYSSYENNGTLGNGVKANAPTWNSSCMVGGCFEFDGDDDYIDFGDVVGDEIGQNNFTISAWINNINEGSNSEYHQPIVVKSTYGSGNWGFDLVSGNQLRFHWDDTSYYSGFYDLNDGVWHHVVVVKSGDELIFYKDMENSIKNGVGSKTLSNDQNLIIGARIPFSAHRKFNGSIDEVQIFNRALSPEQIQEIYQAGLEGHQVEKMVSQETAKGDDWQVALTPNDKIADGVTIYSNTLGIIDAVPEDPSSVTLVSVNGTDESDDDLNCSAYIEDVDNDLLDVEVEWFRDDISVLTQSYSNWENGTTFHSILDSGNLTLGDVWYCSVRTYDGNDYSSWVDSNTLEIVDNTNPEVYIISPLSEEEYNYTTLDVDFNISVIENEEVSMCFYDLDGEGNVSMTDINDSDFWSEPNLGPGPHEVIFWCNDTSNNWGMNSTTFYIEDAAAISIDLSDELSWSVKWNLTYLPVNDLGAIGNNGSGITEYYVSVSVEATTVDLYVKADGDLETEDADVLGLGNETFTYTVNDPFVNNNTNVTMETSYLNIGKGLGDGDVVHLKFFIDAPSAQPAGFYENQLSFKAVRNGAGI